MEWLDKLKNKLGTPQSKKEGAIHAKHNVVVQPGHKMPDCKEVDDLTASLLSEALACADYFEKHCGRQLDPEQFGQIVREFLCAFIHFLDRYSFEMYGHEKRCKITDSIVALLDHLLHEDHGKFKAIDHIGKGITADRGIDTDMLNERNTEYAGLASGNNTEEAEDTMNKFTFAFATHLSYTTRGIKRDFTCVDLAYDLLAYSLDKLNLDEKLKQFREI